MVVAHGQTIWHAPEKGVSWQLFDPQPVVSRLDVRGVLSTCVRRT